MCTCIQSYFLWGICGRGDLIPPVYTVYVLYNLTVYPVGFQEASGEASGQESHAAVSNCHAQTRGPGMQTHVEHGVRVPSPHCVPAIGVRGGLARQGV